MTIRTIDADDALDAIALVEADGRGDIEAWDAVTGSCDLDAVVSLLAAVVNAALGEHQCLTRAEFIDSLRHDFTAVRDRPA